MIVLVCGGRDFGSLANRVRPTPEEIARAAAERSFLRSALDAQHAAEPIALLIHGGARGADREAGAWGLEHGIHVRAFPADWVHDGKAAGPIRNQRMLVQGKPSLVIAFPGGRGTADMVRRSRRAGVRVIEARP